MEFIIYTAPLSYYLYLTHNRYRKYITKRGLVYRELLQGIFKEEMKGGGLINVNCKVDILLYFDNKRKNDVDNFVKNILDCMNGIVFTDDRLVIDLRVRKYLDKNPKIVIKVDFPV